MRTRLLISMMIAMSLIIVIALSGCATGPKDFMITQKDIIVTSSTVSGQPQPFLNRVLSGLKVDRDGNIIGSEIINTVEKKPPASGYVYALIDLDFQNNETRRQILKVSHFSFLGKGDVKLEGFIYYDEGMTDEKGKAGYFPLESNVTYSKTFKPDESEIFKYLVIVPNDATSLSLRYEAAETMIIRLH